MLPELFNIGPIPIRSYGLMLAVSFFLAVMYVRWATKRDNKPFEVYLTTAYLLIFGGVIGARLFYVLFHLSDFSGNWFDSINPFGGDQFGIAGLNLYGGVVVAVLATFIYSRIQKVSILDIFDYFAPTLGLGLAFTRIGCFLNGCCFGTPTELPWGVTFPTGSIPNHIYGDVHLHPSQLYSSLYGLLLFLVLHFMMKKKKFTGQLVAILFMAEALFRYLIEYVRYYEDAMYIEFFGMKPTYNHLISISLFAFGLGIYIYQSRQAKALNPQE